MLGLHTMASVESTLIEHLVPTLENCRASQRAVGSDILETLDLLSLAVVQSGCCVCKQEGLAGRAGSTQFRWELNFMNKCFTRV